MSVEAVKAAQEGYERCKRQFYGNKGNGAAPWNMQRAACSVQHGTCSMLRAHAACNVREVSSAQSFCIGRAFLPWIIRTRHGPQPEEKAACSLHVEAPGGPTHG